MVDENEIDKTLEEMVEHVCDSLCRYPKETADPEKLDRICADCRMSDYVCRIHNQYQLINDFDKSQSYHLLAKLGELRDILRQIKGDQRLTDRNNGVPVPAHGVPWTKILDKLTMIEDLVYETERIE